MTKSTIIEIEFVDYGVQGEYGPFGKVVARSDVRGMSAWQRVAEIDSMRKQLGEHIAAREVEEIPAVSEREVTFDLAAVIPALEQVLNAVLNGKSIGEGLDRIEAENTRQRAEAWIVGAYREGKNDHALDVVQQAIREAEAAR